MLFNASAADINRSKASSDERLKPGPEPPLAETGFVFFPPRIGLSCAEEGRGRVEEERGIVEEESSGQESVIVLSLPESSDLDSVSYALSVFSLSTSSISPPPPPPCPPRCVGDGF